MRKKSQEKNIQKYRVLAFLQTGKKAKISPKITGKKAKNGIVYTGKKALKMFAYRCEIMRKQAKKGLKIEK